MSLELQRPMWSEISSRINGFDGKIAAIRRALKTTVEIERKDYIAAANTLAAVENYKKYRDAVAHIKIFHPDSEVAPSFTRRGKITEVLITKEALDALYKSLEVVDQEMNKVVEMIFYRVRFNNRLQPSKLSEDDKQQFVAGYESALARVRELQAKRDTLPPLPEFPEELEEPQDPEGG
jgi:uncharacterized short protein YbdD (DUF466 family)